MDFHFSIISGKVIAELVKLEPNIVFETVKSTYIEHESGETVNPASFFLKFPAKPKSRIIALPAALTNENKIAGIKWIGSNPDNTQHGFPRASATIILNDYESCYPFACLEGSIISAMRTANSAVLAAEEMQHGRKESKRLGIVGSGLISKYIYQALLQRKWQFEDIMVFDSNPQYGTSFAQYLKNQNNDAVQVKVAANLADLLICCDLIALATTATEPYIHDPALFVHNPIILNISLRDISADIILQSNNVVDDIEHVLQADTSLHLAFKACGNKAFIDGTIGGLIGKKFEITKHKPSIFSPMGMGILDVAVAYCIYNLAVSKKLALNVSDFFYDNINN